MNESPKKSATVITDIEQRVVPRALENLRSSAPKRRMRLNNQQRSFLEHQYLQNQDWSKQEISQFASHLGMPFTKVYKWKWERKKKDGHAAPVTDISALSP